jgi:hypothetical protein
MKDKYGTYRATRRLDVASINDYFLIFAMQVLAFKLLRKCRKDQIPEGVIAAVEKCAAGVQMNWATFFVNQFFIYFAEAQRKSK